MTEYPAAAPPRGALLVLAHGAGAGQHHPFMVSYARALAAAGIDVVTFDFPYMAQKRRAPDRAPVLEAAFRDAIVSARSGRETHRLFIGGKSMGGRIATHLATDPALGLAGVIALGYPLHPPGKPEQKRIAHFPAMCVPWLIVQGERDTFGTPAELRSELAALRGPVARLTIAGGDHSLAVRGRAADDVRREVVDAVVRFMAEPGAGSEMVGPTAGDPGTP
jgi:predicted alpha/beta-hydrolase family hydrolase